jgi:hypothetical protein
LNIKVDKLGLSYGQRKCASVHIFNFHIYIYISRFFFNYYIIIVSTMPTFFFAMLVQKWHTPRADARKCLGYFMWKITILRQKIIFFPILGGRAPGAPPPLTPPLHTTIKVMNSFLIRVAWLSRNTSLFFQVWYIFVFCFRSFVCCFSSFDISFVCF